MERMTPELFRQWFSRFNRQRAIWIEKSGWMPGTNIDPEMMHSIQADMEQTILEWADAIRGPDQVELTTYVDIAPLPPLPAKWSAPMAQVDQRPHSRACGIRTHNHGTDCAPDCPTCIKAP